MKTLLFLLLCSSAHAEEFRLKYKLNGVTLEILQEASNRIEAEELASQKCFDFYKVQRPFSSDYWITVIDHCANPNSRELGQQ